MDGSSMKLRPGAWLHPLQPTVHRAPCCKGSGAPDDRRAGRALLPGPALLPYSWPWCACRSAAVAARADHASNTSGPEPVLLSTTMDGLSSLQQFLGRHALEHVLSVCPYACLSRASRGVVVSPWVSDRDFSSLECH